MPAPGFAVKPLDRRPGELPPLKLDHLRRMTDDTGMLQHAVFTVPNYREGYTTDDNARALIVSALLEELGNGEALRPRARATWPSSGTPSTPETGRFRNFMGYERHWLEESGSDDSHGRALWALGTCSGRSEHARAPQHGRARVRAGAARDPTTRPARGPGPSRSSASTSTCGASPATAGRARCATTWPGGCCRLYRDESLGRLALVRDRPDLLQRRAAARPAAVRAIDAATMP